MQENRLPGGSTTRWGPLFGGRAHDWAETWEGPQGWGIPVYGRVLDRAQIGPGTSVLDCGCGAGRFAQMAADRGASVAGIDAAGELLEIAAERTPGGDFRVGDLEALPWLAIRACSLRSAPSTRRAISMDDSGSLATPHPSEIEYSM